MLNVPTQLLKQYPTGTHGAPLPTHVQKIQPSSSPEFPPPEPELPPPEPELPPPPEPELPSSANASELGTRAILHTSRARPIVMQSHIASVKKRDMVKSSHECRTARFPTTGKADGELLVNQTPAETPRDDLLPCRVRVQPEKALEPTGTAAEAHAHDDGHRLASRQRDR
jgi:hypothetical protein